MFIDFFYNLKNAGIGVSPTSFLTLQKALNMGLVRSLDDFYIAARSILVKSERHFDLYDRIFAHHFEGAELPDPEGFELDEIIQGMLDEWLKDPETLSEFLGIEESEIAKLTPDELIDYFKKRLEEQTGRHDGGNRWIGTRGRSPVGHSGYHPEGMRVGGVSRNKSAVKTAMDRRYKDYSKSGPLTQELVGEALKRLRNLVPSGPKDQINIDSTIRQTIKNGGEIEIVFDRGLKDRLKVILAIDNGGWSMDPYIPVVQTLFNYARSQFKDVKTFYFHNTIYDNLWKDPARYKQPVKVDDFVKYDSETRLIIIGDASMAPYELMAADGSIHLEERTTKPSIERLRFLSDNFNRCAWMNPVPEKMWKYTRTINMIREIFPMFELTIDGLENAVTHLTSKN